MTKSFVHLHVHTEGSMLDGLGTVDDYVTEAKKKGQPALAITDHGNLCMVPAFYSAARKAEIEPIIGCEMYYVEDATWRPAKGSGERSDPNHVTVLARGRRGYQVLVELATETHRQFYGKPLLDRRLIESLSERERASLTVLSGCAGSPVSRPLTERHVRTAVDEMMWWREMFPHYYLEIMDHDTSFDQPLNRLLIKMSRRYDVPLVVTNDPHYVFKRDATHHDCLLAIQTGADIDAPERFRFDGHGYHLRSRAEMLRAMRKYGPQVWAEASSNTVRIAKDCRIRIPDWETRTWHIPRYPDCDDAEALLKTLTIRGLKARRLFHKPEYIERAKHELEVFAQVGIEDFLLITMDIVQEAIRRGIPVGPGRGSVCGTLVGYAIGIHTIDPIRYDLLFERFLNPERPSMPDIDMDFGKARRAELFKYVEDKYGSENVVHVAAFQSLKIRRSFHAIAGAHGIEFSERMRIAKMFGKDTEDDDVEDVLPEEIVERFPDMAAQIVRFNGIKAGISQHPAGVIIADPKDKIKRLVPQMYIASSKKMVAMFDLKASDATGLLKEDLLALRALDTIQECCNIVEDRTGTPIDFEGWIPDEEERDDEVWAMIAAGDTAGVFQMEGPTNMRGAKAVKPTCFEDVVSVTSLYRTGPINAGFPQMFLDNRKMGRKRIKYAHPDLKPILEPTFGVILYQEQVMEIGKVLAGFTMTQVDDIKNAIKYKKSSAMDTLKPVFIEGCRRVAGMGKQAIELLWKQIESYSGYSYNRSHAVAYTMISYRTARLKLLYPLAYITALLRTVDRTKQNIEKRSWYLRTALEQGVKVLPPDINVSDASAGPDWTAKAIRFGLTDIKGVGDAAAAKIVSNRPRRGYRSADQVTKAVNNVGTMKALTAASVLESLGIEGDPAATEELLSWTFEDNMVKYRRKYRRSVRLPDPNVDEVKVVGEIVRATMAETKNGKPYMNWRIRWSLTESWHVRLWSETSRLWSIPEGSVVMVEGDWSEKWGNISVNDSDDVRIIHRARRATTAAAA